VEPTLLDALANAVPVIVQTRHDDPMTSAKAATKASITAKSRAYRLLRFYERNDDLTGDEAATMAGEPIYEARKRISDLLRLGLLEDTGREGQSIAGNDARLLRITTDGHRALDVGARRV
jgi:predicted HTH transcriptional regulator